MDTPRERFVRVVASKPVGPDSIVTVVDPDDPDWPAETLEALGRQPRGAEGYLRFVPGRSSRAGRRRWPDRWAFRPVGGTGVVDETGRPAAEMPSPDGSGPAGD